MNKPVQKDCSKREEEKNNYRELVVSIKLDPDG